MRLRVRISHSLGGGRKDPRDGEENEPGMGTPQWEAPEVLCGSIYDERCACLCRDPGRVCYEVRMRELRTRIESSHGVCLLRA